MRRIHCFSLLGRDAEERSIEHFEVLLQEVGMSAAIESQHGKEIKRRTALSLPLLDAA